MKNDKNNNNNNLIEPLISNKKEFNSNNQKFIYPSNFFSEIFFTWTTNILKLSNSQTKLKPNHFGTFNSNQTSKYFLNKIKPSIKNTKRIFY
jgi:hypothetical protein